MRQVLSANQLRIDLTESVSLISPCGRSLASGPCRARVSRAGVVGLDWMSVPTPWSRPASYSPLRAAVVGRPRSRWCRGRLATC